MHEPISLQSISWAIFQSENAVVKIFRWCKNDKIWLSVEKRFRSFIKFDGVAQGTKYDLRHFVGSGLQSRMQ